jgi:predicted ATPase
MPDETASDRRHREGPWHQGVTIQRWHLGNFKSVENADIELSPLTVLVGANSAGKSSLIQSILAVSQAARGEGVSDRFPLNGGILRLGTVTQNRYAGPGEGGSRPISFGAHFHMGAEHRAWTVSAATRRHLPPDGIDRHVDWQVTLGDSPRNQSGQALIDRVSFSVNHLEVDDEHEEVSRTLLDVSAPRDATVDRESTAFQGTWDAGDTVYQIADAALRGGVPVLGVVEKDIAEIAWSAWNEAFRLGLERVTWRQAGRSRRDWSHVQQMSLDDEPETDYRPYVERIAHDIVETYENYSDPGRVDIEVRLRNALRDRYLNSPPTDIPPQLLYNPVLATLVRAELEQRGLSGTVPVRQEMRGVTDVGRSIVEFLSSGIFYLGPLREDPRVVYQDSAEASGGYVGAKGEYLAAVLQSSSRRKVDVPLPGMDLGEHTMVTLREALNRWIQFLDIGQAVTTSDRGRLGLELTVEQQHVGVTLDLTSVGTGVSQLLPVLVMCLRSPRGSLLLMEQPELHLNPGVQQRLADFLLAIAAAGRQVIVETHSEYMISRLRLRVADDETDEVRQTFGLLFAVRTEGRTTYDRVETNEFGGLESWPEGFFDHSAEESRRILKAAVDKRRRLQANAPTPVIVEGDEDA